MTVYLNTYHTWQQYGGPEEGGWWFDCGEPLQSILLSLEDLEEFQDRHTAPEDAEHFYIDDFYKPLEIETAKFTTGEKPQTGYGGYTFMPGSDEPLTYDQGEVVSRYEDDYAKAYPEQRPHYE